MARKNATGNADGADAIEDLVKAELKRIGYSSVVKTEEIQARLMKVEQKLARRGAAHAGAMGVVDVKSIGSQVKGTQELEMFLKGATPTTRIALDVKSIVSDGATPNVSPFAQNVPGIQAPVVRRLTVESLIPSTQVTTGSFNGCASWPSRTRRRRRKTSSIRRPNRTSRSRRSQR
ncbi:hypothetical protein IECKMCGE_13585 [Robbsia andropogonis]|nr:hypothetical protein [Robbsia andropogonis]